MNFTQLFRKLSKTGKKFKEASKIFFKGSFALSVYLVTESYLSLCVIDAVCDNNATYRYICHVKTNKFDYDNKACKL
jgi:hypothetical protein